MGISCGVSWELRELILFDIDPETAHIVKFITNLRQNVFLEMLISDTRGTEGVVDNLLLVAPNTQVRDDKLRQGTTHGKTSGHNGYIFGFCVLFL